MKKTGFTLAEVLVTLGIIGVVAALAMPALNSAVQKTKVGPTLRKFMYTLENANRMLMQETDVDDLSLIDYNIIHHKYESGMVGADRNNSMLDYVFGINKHIAGGSYKVSDVGQLQSVYVNGTKISVVPFLYTFGTGEQFYCLDNYPASDGYPTYTGSAFANVQPDTNYGGKLYWVFYDMNGFDESTGKPNKFGKDQFVFYVDKNGAVLPLGSKAVSNAYCSDAAGETKEPVVSGDCADTTGDKACQSPLAAGAIANNNWKVGYKY